MRTNRTWSALLRSRCSRGAASSTGFTDVFSKVGNTLKKFSLDKCGSRRSCRNAQSQQQQKSLRSHEMPPPRHLAEEDVALQRGLQVGLQEHLAVSRRALLQLPAQPLRCAPSVPRPWLPAAAAGSNIVEQPAWKQIPKTFRGKASLENSTTTSVHLGHSELRSPRANACSKASPMRAPRRYSATRR